MGKKGAKSVSRAPIDGAAMLRRVFPLLSRLAHSGASRELTAVIQPV
ncbi:hypothetical protein Fuma_05951 [Fuerstiella marisgermanici]|uniref:Uncharacterized protein n=1 Tax=Fuerstiella marisgermanici TaxID=1891926 RepID=A0A1P8WQF4_9PLAN|nr:hypothetical protein Fuma_05951 [Fuerstiella marisgermanici]